MLFHLINLEIKKGKSTENGGSPHILSWIWAFLLMVSPGGSDSKESACSAGDPGLILTHPSNLCSNPSFSGKTCWTMKIYEMNQFSSVHFSRSVVSDSLQPHESALQTSLSIMNSQSLLKLMSIELVMPYVNTNT